MKNFSLKWLILMAFILGSNSLFAGTCINHDSASNGSAAGDLITELDGITNDISVCIEGVSPNKDSDYYYFEVATAGQLDITTSSPNNHKYRLEIGSTENGDEYYEEDSEIAHSIDTITLEAGDKVYLFVHEKGKDTDEYQINFIFTKSGGSTPVATAIAQYRFDECLWDGTAGEVKDSSGNGFDGVAIGVIRTDINGTINKGGKFISDDASVRVENITGLDSNNFSLSFWTKIKTTGWIHELIQVGNGTSSSNWGVLELRYSQSDHKMYLSVDHANGNKYQQYIVVDLNDEAWHHIALTNKDGIIKLHIDNTLYTFTHSFGTRIPFDGVLKIGDADHNFYTQTEMDEVKLYSTILSDSEISSIYTNEKSRKNADGSSRAADSCPIVAAPVELIAEYKLDECLLDGTSGEVKDSSGNGFDGVANGAITDITDGQVNGSGKFVGADDSVKVEGISGLDPNNFSVSFWVKIDPDASSDNRELIKLGNVNVGDVNNGDWGIAALRYNTSNQEFRVTNSYIKPDGTRGGSSQVATFDMNDGAWHHVVYIYHDEYMQAYIDNQELDFIHNNGSTGGISHAWHMTPFNGELYMGNYINGLFSTKISLDEVKLYNGVLNDSKISEIYINEKAHKNADGSDRDAVNCPTPFSCQAQSFVSFNTESSPRSGDSKYNTISLLDGNLTAEDNVTGVNGVNSIGYNVKDDLIWGYNLDAYQVVQIDADKKATLFNVSGLDTRFYVAADVSSDGVLYLFSRGNSTERTHIARVNLDTLTSLPEVTLTQEINTADFAFNPQDEKLYFIQKDTDDLYKITFSADGLTGTVDPVGDLELGTVNPIINFFDKDGNFYFNKDTTTMYKVNVASSAKATPFSILDNALRNGDGARCADAPVADKPIITISDSQVVEGNSGTQNITFTISADRLSSLNIDYTFSDGSAVVGSDYIASAGTITMFNESSKTVTLSIINGDTDIELDEDFLIHLSSTNAIFLDNTAKGTIINDDFDIRMNAMTTTSGFEGNITTQIVNQNFNFTIKAYDFTRNQYVEDMNITKLEIIQEDGTTISTWDSSVQTDATGSATVSVSVDRAVKIASVKLYGDYNGSTYQNNATDNFAVRPDRFLFIPPTNPKAGKAFTPNLKAVDLANKRVQAYNEAITTSFDINYTEINSSCATGTMDLSTIQFTNGEITQDINYSEVGKLDFNISEILGQEFALVDENDTNEAQRLITATNVSSVEFVAGYFKIENWSLNNGAQDFTYYAKLEDIANMGAEFNATIKAYDMSGILLTNYHKGCYAKNTNLEIKYITEDGTGTLNWADQIEGQIHNGKGLAGSFTFDINSSRFTHGETNPIIYINFGRDVTTAKKPLRLKITNTDLSISNSDGAIGGSDLALIQSADFYYGRMHTPNYYGSGEEHNITVFHEVYAKDADKSKFIYANAKESEDSINWYILKYAQYNDGGEFTDFDSKNNDDFIDRTTNSGQIISGTSNVFEIDNVDSIKLEIPKAPFRDRITYKPDAWLVFNRFSATKDTHSFNINISSSSGWAGKGKEGLTTKGNASRKNSQKMDW